MVVASSSYFEKPSHYFVHSSGEWLSGLAISPLQLRFGPAPCAFLILVALFSVHRTVLHCLHLSER